MKFCPCKNNYIYSACSRFHTKLEKIRNPKSLVTIQAKISVIHSFELDCNTVIKLGVSVLYALQCDYMAL